MVTKIKSGNKIFALLLDLTDIKEGTFPVTEPSWSLQMLMMKRKKGHVVSKHKHKKIWKSSRQPQEAIVVIKGLLLVTIFDQRGSTLGQCRVASGQCLLIVDGGHEVSVKNDSLIYAFKDGPYVNDKILL